MARIGVFDSGAGGITVLHEAMRMLQAPEYLYYMDRAHVPYGTKTVEEITRYAKEAVSFLRGEGADLVVLACNTATSAAANTLRAAFDFPIVGMEPAVKPALALSPEGERERVLVLATPLTLKEKKLADLVARFDAAHRVDLLAMPRLVSFAEEGRFDTGEVRAYLEETLRETERERYRAVVPGCTHFLYFLPLLKELFPAETAWIDGTEGTVRRIAELLGLPAEGRALTGEVTYYDAGRKITEEKELERIAALHARLEEIGR
ncbi:MAG: glutamate racemase [Lachnospiraceae bacterium]|nr:glutamate racemase [Lachnospiraceae bacterium]